MQEKPTQINEIMWAFGHLRRQHSTYLLIAYVITGLSSRRFLGGGRLGEGTQARVPLKQKYPRI